MVATARKKRRASEPQDYPAAAAGTLRRDNAVAHIRKLIVSMKLGVGDRLPGERQLAAKFNLSRGTVREALQFLAALNLVEIRHGGGCFLRASSGENKEVRAEWRDWVARHRGRVLETLEVRLGCETFEAAAEARDVPAFVQSDVDFHGALLLATGNKALQDLVGALGKELIPERAATLDIVGRLPRSFAEHTAIYDEILQGDSRAAELAMHRHLEGARRDVFEHLLGDAAIDPKSHVSDEPPSVAEQS